MGTAELTKAEDVCSGNPQMLTVRMTAELLGVSLSLVYGLCAAGKILHERHGLGRGVIRIPAGALDEYRQAASVSTAKTRGEPLVLKHLTIR